MIFDKFIGINALCDFLKPSPLEKKKRKTAKSIAANCLFWTPKDFCNGSPRGRGTVISKIKTLLALECYI